MVLHLWIHCLTFSEAQVLQQGSQKRDLIGLNTLWWYMEAFLFGAKNVFVVFGFRDVERT